MYYILGRVELLQFYSKTYNLRAVLHVGKQLEMYYTGKGLDLAVRSVLHV